MQPLLTGRVPGSIQQQLVMSAGFIVLPFAGTGVVNCAVLPRCFYNMHLKVGFSDQTLNGKIKAYGMFCTIYCYRPLHVSVFIHREAAEAQKIFVVDLCKHSV